MNLKNEILKKLQKNNLFYGVSNLLFQFNCEKKEVETVIKELKIEGLIKETIINHKFYYRAINHNFCSMCGIKLISDKLSKKYGDYCSNLNCEAIN